jgi:hypothetical protein
MFTISSPTKLPHCEPHTTTPATPVDNWSSGNLHHEDGNGGTPGHSLISPVFNEEFTNQITLNEVEVSVIFLPIILAFEDAVLHDDNRRHSTKAQLHAVAFDITLASECFVCGESN